MTPEHPEDKAVRIAAEKEAIDRIDEFVEKHKWELKYLIQVYEDRIAGELLERLRELFWIGIHR